MAASRVADRVCVASRCMSELDPDGVKDPGGKAPTFHKEAGPEARFGIVNEGVYYII